MHMKILCKSGYFEKSAINALYVFNNYYIPRELLPNLYTIISSPYSFFNNS